MPAFLPPRPPKEILGRPGLTTVYVILMIFASLIFFNIVFIFLNPEDHPNITLISILSTIVFLGVSVIIKNLTTPWLLGYLDEHSPSVSAKMDLCGEKLFNFAYDDVGPGAK
jgi:hypothetical protein